MQCSGCGTSLVAGSLFCHKCGTKQAPASPVAASSSSPLPSSSSSSTATDARTHAQQVAYTKWLNHKLKQAGSRKQAGNLERDLCDGILLCELIGFLKTKRPPPPPFKVWSDLSLPKDKFKAVENASTFLREFQQLFPSTKVTIGPYDIVDGSFSPIMGMLWRMIQTVQLDVTDFEDESKAAGSRRQGDRRTLAFAKADLLRWFDARVRPFGLTVTDFGDSLKDGRAFLALAASYDSAGCPYQSRVGADGRRNLQTAFDDFERLGIPQLLEVESVGVDEGSVVTYLSIIQGELGGAIPPPASAASSASVPSVSPAAAAASAAAARAPTSSSSSDSSTPRLPTDQEASFVVAVQNPPADLAFRIRDPEGQLIIPRVERLPGDQFKVSFVPKLVGDHQVECTTGSSSSVMANFHAEKSAPDTARASTSLIVGQQATFICKVKGAGPGTNFRVREPSGGFLQPTVVYLGDENFKISFTPPRAGLYTPETLEGAQMAPVQAVEADVSGVDAKTRVEIVGQPATLILTLENMKQEPQFRVVEAARKAIIQRQVDQLGPNQYRIVFTPANPGDYHVQSHSEVLATIRAVLPR